MTGIATKPTTGTPLSMYRFPLWVAVITALVSAYLATSLAFSVLLFTGHFGDPAYWRGFALIGSIPYLIFAMVTGTAAILLTTMLRLLAVGSLKKSIVSGAIYAAVAAVGGYAFVLYSQDPDGLTAEVVYAACLFGLTAVLGSIWVAFSTKPLQTDHSNDDWLRAP